MSAAVNDATLDARARMGVWQLTNCAFDLFFDSQNKLLTIFLLQFEFAAGYFLLGLISSLVFRAVRDALPHDPVAQERIVGASLTALALADVRPMYIPCL